MTPLAARALLSVQESLLGRDTVRILRRLDPGPGPAALADVRDRDLGRLLDHAWSNIPYWRERLGPPPAGGPGAWLARTPVLTRTEISRRRHDMLWRGGRGKVLCHRSGGTTDDNLAFFWGRGRQSWDRAMRYRGLARHGIVPGDRVLHLWPRYPAPSRAEACKQWARDWRDRLTNDVVFDLRPLTPEALDAALDFCARYRPALVIGYPSWLAALAARRRVARPTWRCPALRRVMCCGEVLFDFQRRAIAEAFGVPVFEEYGSQDAGLIAHEDAAGRLRLNAEQMAVEVLRDGRPAAPGALGEVVVTHFHTEVMPFIRYATGDVVRQPAAAAAGPGLPAFPWPEGRTSDQLVTADGEVVPMRPVVEALVARAGLSDFSLYQAAPGAVTVLEVGGSGRARGPAGDVLRAHLGRWVRVGWLTGSGFLPFTSGKRRYVCSPAALGLLAHDREAGRARARAWPQRLIGPVAAAAPAGGRFDRSRLPPALRARLAGLRGGNDPWSD